MELKTEDSGSLLQNLHQSLKAVWEKEPHDRKNHKTEEGPFPRRKGQETTKQIPAALGRPQIEDNYIILTQDSYPVLT